MMCSSSLYQQQKKNNDQQQQDQNRCQQSDSNPQRELDLNLKLNTDDISITESSVNQSQLRDAIDIEDTHREHYIFAQLHKRHNYSESFENKAQQNAQYANVLKEVVNPTKNNNRDQANQKIFKEKPFLFISLNRVNRILFPFLQKIITKFQEIQLKKFKSTLPIEVNRNEHDLILSDQEKNIIESVKDLIEPQSEWARELYGDNYFNQQNISLKSKIKLISDTINRIHDQSLNSALLFQDCLSNDYKKIDYPSLIQMGIYLNNKLAAHKSECQLKIVLIVIGQYMPKNFDKHYMRLFKHSYNNFIIINILDIEEKYSKESNLFFANQHQTQQASQNQKGSDNSLNENGISNNSDVKSSVSLNQYNLNQNQIGGVNKINTAQNNVTKTTGITSLTNLTKNIANEKSSEKQGPVYKVYNLYLRKKEFENLKVSSPEFIHLMHSHIFPFLRNQKIDVILFEYDFSFSEDVNQSVVLKSYVLAHIIQKLKEISRDRLIVLFHFKQLRQSLDCYSKKLTELSQQIDSQIQPNLSNSSKKRTQQRGQKSSNSTQSMKVSFEYSQYYYNSLKMTLLALGSYISYDQYINQKIQNFQFHPSLAFTQHISQETKYLYKSSLYKIKGYSKIAEARNFISSQLLNPAPLIQKPNSLKQQKQKQTSIISTDHQESNPFQQQDKKQQQQQQQQQQQPIVQEKARKKRKENLKKQDQADKNDGIINQKNIFQQNGLNNQDENIMQVNSYNIFNNNFQQQQQQQQQMQQQPSNYLQIQNNIQQQNDEYSSYINQANHIHHSLQSQSQSQSQSQQYNIIPSQLNPAYSHLQQESFSHQQLQQQSLQPQFIYQQNSIANNNFNHFNSTNNHFNTFYYNNNNNNYNSINNNNNNYNYNNNNNNNNYIYNNNPSIDNFNVYDHIIQGFPQQVHVNNNQDSFNQLKQLENQFSFSNNNYPQSNFYQQQNNEQQQNSIDIEINSNVQILGQKDNAHNDDDDDIMKQQQQFSQQMINNLNQFSIDECKQQNLFQAYRGLGYFAKIQIQQIIGHSKINHHDYEELVREYENLKTINQIKVKKASKLKDSIYHLHWEKQCKLEISNQEEFPLKIFLYDENAQYIVQYFKDERDPDNLHEIKMVIYFFNVRFQNKFRNFILKQITNKTALHQQFQCIGLNYKNENIPLKKIADPDEKITEQQALFEQFNNAKYTIGLLQKKIKDLEDILENNLKKASNEGEENRNSNSQSLKNEERRNQQLLSYLKRDIQEMEKKKSSLEKKTQDLDIEIKGPKVTKTEDLSSLEKNGSNIEKKNENLDIETNAPKVTGTEEQNSSEKKGLEQKEINVSLLCIAESTIVETEEYIFKFFGRLVNIRQYETSVQKQETKIIMRINKYKEGDYDKSIEFINPTFSQQIIKNIMQSATNQRKQQTAQPNKQQPISNKNQNQGGDIFIQKPQFNAQRQNTTENQLMQTKSQLPQTSGEEAMFKTPQILSFNNNHQMSSLNRRPFSSQEVDKNLDSNAQVHLQETLNTNLFLVNNPNYKEYPALKNLQANQLSSLNQINVQQKQTSASQFQQQPHNEKLLKSDMNHQIMLTSNQMIDQFKIPQKQQSMDLRAQSCQQLLRKSEQPIQQEQQLQSTQNQIDFNKSIVFEQGNQKDSQRKIIHSTNLQPQQTQQNQQPNLPKTTQENPQQKPIQPAPQNKLRSNQIPPLRGRFGASGFYLKNSIYIFNGLSSQFQEETALITFKMKKNNERSNKIQSIMEGNNAHENNTQQNNAIIPNNQTENKTTNQELEENIDYYCAIKFKIGKFSNRGGLGSILLPIITNQNLKEVFPNFDAQIECETSEGDNGKYQKRMLDFEEKNRLHENLSEILFVSFESLDCECNLKKQLVKFQVYNTALNTITNEKHVTLLSTLDFIQIQKNNVQNVLNLSKFFEQPHQSFMKIANKNNTLNEFYYEMNKKLFYTVVVEDFRNHRQFIQMTIDISKVSQYFQSKQAPNNDEGLEGSFIISIIQP